MFRCGCFRASHGVVQGSHLGLEIDDSTIGACKILLDVQRSVLAILDCSEVFDTLFASRLFSRPRAPPSHKVSSKLAGDHRMAPGGTIFPPLSYKEKAIGRWKGSKRLDF